VDPTVSFEEAIRIVLDSARPIGGETVNLMEASDRILSEDIISDRMIPPVDDSAMDGYAVIAKDTKGASKDHPVRLKIVGEIKAGGSIENQHLSSGSAIRIMTGAPIPEGADSVIPFEDTMEDADYVILFCESVERGNCKCAGENIRNGDLVLQKGDRLKSADIGILASLNRDVVPVYRRPTVSIVSTGDEIAEVGHSIKSGQIRNINAYTLYSEVRKYHALPQYLGIARDTVEDIRGKLIDGLSSDMVISTGGVSKGRYDLVKEIYHDLGIDILFEWIKIKPGRPCTFGRKNNTLVFGLPGYPVPVLTSFIQFVRPALLKLMGARKIDKPIINAILDEDITNRCGSVNLLRGQFTVRENEFHVSTTGSQKPSILRSMSKANCLIVMTENSQMVKAGDKVTIQLIGHDEI
jgi:molybdopterin molybdotransferase